MDDDDKKTGDASAGASLSEEQITSGRIDRRSVLRSAGIAGLGAGALGLSGCVVVPAGPVYGTGYTDADNGPIVDPVGSGRGPRRGYYTGITDADNGPIVDPVGQGRG